MTPETLKRIEWAGYVDDTFDNGTLPVCPCCRALQHYGKHAPGCELKADLDAAVENATRKALQQRINEHLDICIHCDPGLS